MTESTDVDQSKRLATTFREEEVKVLCQLLSALYRNTQASRELLRNKNLHSVHQKFLKMKEKCTP